jgi:hypothetical protein
MSGDTFEARIARVAAEYRPPTPLQRLDALEAFVGEQIASLAWTSFPTYERLKRLQAVLGLEYNEDEPQSEPEEASEPEQPERPTITLREVGPDYVRPPES